MFGALKGVMKNRGLGINVEKVLYENVLMPTVLYGSFMGYESNRQKLNVFEIKCQEYDWCISVG